jgi:hypothetical protein
MIYIVSHRSYIQGNPGNIIRTAFQTVFGIADHSIPVLKEKWPQKA